MELTSLSIDLLNFFFNLLTHIAAEVILFYCKQEKTLSLAGMLPLVANL